MTSTILSGITPSGRLTLGNHLGALRRFAVAQHLRRSVFFVADLHALTTPHDPERLRRLTRETVVLFLAAGIDAEHAIVFRQSDVLEHVGLAYLLECTAYVGELNRMIQFKDKGGRPGTRASLYTYPCLMAADILAYDTTSVPVGGDQDQHVELTRDLAMRFNSTYGKTFVVPKLDRAAIAARVADLAEPTRKMSKSEPDESVGVVRLLDPPDLARRKIMRAVTDSLGVVRHDPVGQPGVTNLLEILAACTDASDAKALVDEHRTYAAVKAATADAVVAVLEPLQQRYAELAAAPDHVDAVLRDGADRARSTAAVTLARARAAIGLR